MKMTPYAFHAQDGNVLVIQGLRNIHLVYDEDTLRVNWYIPRPEISTYAHTHLLFLEGNVNRTIIQSSTCKNRSCHSSLNRYCSVGGNIFTIL